MISQFDNIILYIIEETMKNIASKNRNYKPSKIGDSLRNINQKFQYRFGKLEFTIYSKWLQIVGPFFAENSEPLKIVSIFVEKNESNEDVFHKFLHVNVTPSIAVEFQHFQNKIVEKINSFFGYSAIRGIKIHQKLVINNNNNIKYSNIKYKNTSKIIEEIKSTNPKINDKKLQQSIINLGISIETDE